MTAHRAFTALTRETDANEIIAQMSPKAQWTETYEVGCKCCKLYCDLVKGKDALGEGKAAPANQGRFLEYVAG